MSVSKIAEFIAFMALWLLTWWLLEKLFDRYMDRPWLKWTWDWEVTFGIAIHHNLLPEFIWIWKQGTPPPWRRK